MISHFSSIPSPQSMELIPTHEEITKKNLGSILIAPGPDDLTSGFFKSAWDFLEHEFLMAVSQFLASGFLSVSVNATILTLIPKFLGALAISDYKPISCLN